MPAENTNNVWLIGSRVGHQVRCLTPSMLQDLSAMEHNQNSCSSHQSVTTTQWVWHQKSWNLPHPVFWVVGWYFHLLWIHSLKTLCSALNPLTDQALHYPYSVRVLSEVIQLMLFPLQKIVQRLALIMPRLSARVLYGPTCCCFPPLLSGHVAKSWKWTEPCLFRGSFCQSLSARKFTS